MALTRVLLLVLAGGAGGRLGALTDERAKPAVPFGGTLRLIDFSLSNAQHSHVPDMWVLEQFHPASLSDQLANGRPWDLDRSFGGLLVLHPHLGDDREIDLAEILGRLSIDRLREIVARRVIPLRPPPLDEHVLRRIPRKANLQG